MERNNHLLLEIRELPQTEAVAFIRSYHYSKVLPRLIKYYLGFYADEQLLGVVTLGWGTQPLQTIKKIFPKHDLVTASYLEIGKMCFLPSENHNGYFGSLPSQHLQSGYGRIRAAYFIYPCRRHYGKMRLCIPSC